MYNKSRSFAWAPILAVCPALILYTLFILFPALGNIFFSFTDYQGIHDSFKWVGFDNYIRAFTYDFNNLWNSIKVTAIFSISIISIQTIISLGAAILVNKKLKLRKLYRSVLFLPTVLGVVVHGLIWTLMFDPFSGPFAKLFQIFGINSAMLGDPDMALGLIIFVMIWSNFGYAMVLYLAGLQGIPQELYESGSLDGATGFKAFWYITFPLIRPVVTINVLLSIIGTLKKFDLIYIMTGGGPGDSTMTLGMYIFSNLLGQSTSKGYVAALQMINFVLVLIVVLISQRQLRKGEVEL